MGSLPHHRVGQDFEPTTKRCQQIIPQALVHAGGVCSSALHSSQLLAPRGNTNLISQTDVPKHEQQIFHASNPPQGDQQSRWGSWSQHQPWGEQAVRSCETQMLLLIITPLYWGAVLETISTRAFPYMDRAGWSWVPVRLLQMGMSRAGDGFALDSFQRC